MLSWVWKQLEKTYGLNKTSLCILRELRNKKETPAIELRRRIVDGLHISHQTFYNALNRLVEADLVQREKKGRGFILDTTPSGETRLAQISLEQVKLGREASSAEEAQILIDNQAYGLLKDQVRLKLKEIEDSIDTLTKTGAYLYETRHRVWDALGDLYLRAKREILVMAKGADVSQPNVGIEIRYLLDSTRQVINENKAYSRIQPIDTWCSWLEFVRDVKFSNKPYHDRDNVKILLTPERPQFVLQMNIKDDDEIVLVPRETESNPTHGFHVFVKSLVENYRSDFFKMEQSLGAYNMTSSALKMFTENVRKIREMQTHLLVVLEFDRQSWFWSGSRARAPALTYLEAQRYFPVDWKLWNLIFLNLVQKDGLLASYCEHGSFRTLWDSYNFITQGGSGQASDLTQLLQFDDLPVYTRSSIGMDVMKYYFYKNQSIEESAKYLISYFSEKCLPAVLSKIISRIEKP